MSKTRFGPGVIVTSQWLNGAQEIYFDGANEDWHYAPLNSNDIQRGGTDGLDRTYVSLDTDQVYGAYPVTGNKTFMGSVSFGDTANSNGTNAPLSFSTNTKFNIGGDGQTFNVKYANLSDEDLVTKEILTERVDNFPIIDEGGF